MSTVDRATILIVDDDVTLARAFAQVLGGHGYDVRLAGGAEEALRELDRSRPDAILLDLRMPLINGLGFLYRIRAMAAYQSTPVIVITGDSTLGKEVLVELGELGAQVHFKPITVNDLLATTDALVRRRGLVFGE